MTGRRQTIAGVLVAVSLGVALLSGKVAAAVSDSAMRSMLAARWSAANHRPVSELAQHRRFASPPRALATLAQRELSSGHYRLGVANARQPSTALPWWLRAWQWIAERWRSFWRTVFGNVAIGHAQSVAIGDALLACAAAAVFVAALRLFGGLMFERASRGRAEPVSRVADASEWYAGAVERARRGDYAGATQWLFAAAVAALSGRGLLDDDRSATVGEFQATLRRRYPQLVPAFDAVASEFVAATYAQVPVAAAQWERARDAYCTLQAEVRP